MEELPFRTLVYRYFFFGWLFREVENGNMFERAAVARHNRQQARWLPLYMLRWVKWSFATYVVAAVFEIPLESPVTASLLYAVSGVCVAFGVMTATAWVGLTQRNIAE